MVDIKHGRYSYQIEIIEHTRHRFLNNLRNYEDRSISACKVQGITKSSQSR